MRWYSSRSTRIVDCAPYWDGLSPPWALIQHAEAVEKPDLDITYNLPVPFHSMLFKKSFIVIYRFLAVT